MRHKMRFTSAVTARAGAPIAGVILSAAIISSGPALAAEPWPSTKAEMQQVIYTPWAKFCVKGVAPFAPLRPGSKENAPLRPSKEVCSTVKNVRTKDGQAVMTAVLIESEGRPKAFHVALPSPLQSLSARTIIDKEPAMPISVSIIIDKEPAISSTVTCFANCWADYEATPELIDKLKKGQMLQIQVLGLAVPTLPFLLPLADSSGNSFAEANEGPPTDPRVFQEQQQEFREQQHKMRCAFCQEPLPNETFAAARRAQRP